MERILLYLKNNTLPCGIAVITSGFGPEEVRSTRTRVSMGEQ